MFLSTTSIDLLWTIICMIGMLDLIIAFLVLKTYWIGKELRDGLLLSRGYQQLTEQNVITAQDKLDKVDENVKETKTNVEEIKTVVTDTNGPLSGLNLNKPH